MTLRQGATIPLNPDPEPCQDPASQDHDPEAGGDDPSEPWLSRWLGGGLLYSEADLQPGLHAHCCGHMMHLRCFETHKQTIQALALTTPYFPGYQVGTGGMASCFAWSCLCRGEKCTVT